MKIHSCRPKAFSFLEVSISILIVGILIAAVSQGLDLLDDYKITTAQKLTRTSKAASTPGVVVWYETSLDESFSDTDKVDGATVAQWNDINTQSSLKINAYAGQKTDSSLISYNVATGGTSGNTSGPTYVKNGINGLPTLRFTNDGVNAYRYLAVDHQMKNSPAESLTLFFVMRYRSGSGFFIDRTCTSTPSSSAANSCAAGAFDDGWPLFELYVAVDGSLWAYPRSYTGQFPSIAADGWDTGFNLQPDQNYVITFQRDYGRNFTVYINGNSTYTGGIPSKADNGDPIDLNPYRIGRHIINNTENPDFDLSEFILISGDMKVAARKEIEDYLGKKYNIRVTH